MTIALSRCRKSDPNRVPFANHFRDSLTRLDRDSDAVAKLSSFATRGFEAIADPEPPICPPGCHTARSLRNQFKLYNALSDVLLKSACAEEAEIAACVCIGRRRKPADQQGREQRTTRPVYRPTAAATELPLVLGFEFSMLLFSRACVRSVVATWFAL